jgi:hypothetical protein
MSNIEIRRVSDGTHTLLVDGQDISAGITSATLHIGSEHALLTVEPAIISKVGGDPVVSVGREMLRALVSGTIDVPAETRIALIALGWTPPGTPQEICRHVLADPPCPTCGRGMEDKS